MSSPRETSNRCHSPDQISEARGCEDPHHSPRLALPTLLQGRHNQSLDHRVDGPHRRPRSHRQPCHPPVHTWDFFAGPGALACVLKMCQSRTFVGTGERNIFVMCLYPALLPIPSPHCVINNIDVFLTKQSGRLTRVCQTLKIIEVR